MIKIGKILFEIYEKMLGGGGGGEACSIQQGEKR